jgi:hypothetical protein
MNTPQAAWQIVIAAGAVIVPAVLGFYYFAAQRRSERTTVTKALQTEILRLRGVLQGHLRWIEKPQSAELPLVPFETAIYDSNVQKIGMLDSSFATTAVLFYGALHFVNSLQKARADYYQVAGGREQFVHSYRKAIQNAFRYASPGEKSETVTDSS